ncbi:MAG: glycerophosphodiester phosphodiesterase [Candidatus Promineifilaceae bacterium]|jgi:glycerophosphoryl diester phosphodiesterase
MERYWWLFTLLILLLILGFILWPRQSINQYPWFDQFDQYPLVTSHADDTGSGLWPGITMTHLEGVAGLGVDVLEMDAHMTSDGHIVLMHDDTVDRTTNGSGLVSDFTLEELQQLEVGVNWTQDEGATYPYQGKGLQIPTVEEVFQRFPDYPMVIEIKQDSPSMAEPFCVLIRQYDKTEKVLVPSFSGQTIAEFRAACPEVATASASDETRNFVIANFLMAANLIKPAYQAFQVPEESGGIPVVIPHFISSAHDRGLQVHVWTINDADDMHRLIDMGVDGIMTDRPDILKDILGR